MNDSDQDFVDLCSKLLKRVRKKPGEPKQSSNAAHQPLSQASEGEKRRRNARKDGGPGSKCRSGAQSVCTETDQLVVSGGTDHESGVASSSVSAAVGSKASGGLGTKEKVLNRMQMFKRVNPQKMVHKDKSWPSEQEKEGDLSAAERQGTPQPSGSSLHSDPPVDRDEVLALRLQQELDREAAESQLVDLEDRGLFLCQICHRDLSHMTPEGRTQHLNRCLDESEHVPTLPPPLPRQPPAVPDCPICGKKFKSQKSRSTHLKRCSSDMGVSPAVLLQALQRQAEETQNAANSLTQTGGTKRKGASKPGLAAKKKSRKKAEPLDEDTLVALALSSSLLEQEKEQQQREGGGLTQTAASHLMTPVLKWRPDAGKGRGKRKKGAVPRPPPLLLVQDAEVAQMRLQERVSALLLRSRAPSPPTPTRCPSSLPGWSGAAPLWQKSALLNISSSWSDFYTQELQEFITPWESPVKDVTSSTSNKPGTFLQPVSGGTSVPTTQTSILPSSQMASCSPAPSSLEAGQLSVGSQALRDLMELAEDGMTLTQCAVAALDRTNRIRDSPSTNLHVSGFVPEESEEQADLCASGFLPEKTLTDVKQRKTTTPGQTRRTPDQHGAVKERDSQQSVAVSKLASDLSSMVNNPQLSDLQLQVDSGEVFFAHCFMVYTRCPLLAEMVHESGFGVQEEDMPAAQRVLVTDVPGEAVLALLQYLYTAQLSIPESLQPHVLELASRFGLEELQQLCELHTEEAPTEGDDGPEEHLYNQTDQAFMDLLRSMWNEEEDEDEGADGDGGKDEENVEKDCQSPDSSLDNRDVREEQVDEKELEEIYEFAATQKKREEEKERTEEKIDEAEDVETTEPSGFSEKTTSELDADPSLDGSHNQLFLDARGPHKEEDKPSLNSTSIPPNTHTSRPQQHLSPHTASSKLSVGTFLQSSASTVNDLSLSPLPSTSMLPVPGLSPGLGRNCDGGRDKGSDVELEVPLKHESQGPCSIHVPVVPDSPPKKKEPELIVLSDSSEDMEVDDAVLDSCSPSLCSPRAAQTTQSYTHIKAQPVSKPHEPTLEKNQPSSLEFRLTDGSSSRADSSCNMNPVDCSPEVSWLIPSTPIQPGRSSRTSSSSMCRTKLFPRADMSSPSPSVHSFPASPLNNRLQTPNSPTRGTAGSREGSAYRMKPDGMVSCSSSMDLNFGPTRTSGCLTSKDREMNSPVFVEPTYQQPKLSHLTHPLPIQDSSNQDTPLHLKPHPYSSTPLDTDVLQPPVLPVASPLHTGSDKQRPTSQEKNRSPPESPEVTDLGSFHLSPLSNPSYPPSCSSDGGPQNPERQSKSSNCRQGSAEPSSNNNTEDEKMKGIRNEDGQMGCEDIDDGEQDGSKEKTGQASESSFQQSFMIIDEPPIAFNDSWGLNACDDVVGNLGRFSLRLEDSRGSSIQERSPGLKPTTFGPLVQPVNGQGGVTSTATSKTFSSQPSTSEKVHTNPSPPDPPTCSQPEVNGIFMDSKIWDSWEEEEDVLPLSQRVNPSVQVKTPAKCQTKRRRSLVPITPMPHYSDMDTPELKNKLNRFGVRPLPKRQMILKLKEIHQYTHQLDNSDSEDEVPCVGRAAQKEPPPSSSVVAGSRPVSSVQIVKFKEPRAPAAVSPVRGEEEVELLSASQDSNTSSTAASEESERSNPELGLPSDGDSDSDDGISASQAVTRLQDRLQAVQSLILSDSGLYAQILQYQPLSLSHLQQRLKAAGIRLGAAKLVDYLDSQCITFTTAKPGQSAPSRRRGKRAGRGGKAAGEGGACRKRGVTAMI
ncbi:structure-specific endonuclease subunit SLX4 [Aulostomus maculatus]